MYSQVDQFLTAELARMHRGADAERRRLGDNDAARTNATVSTAFRRIVPVLLMILMNEDDSHDYGRGF